MTLRLVCFCLLFLSLCFWHIKPNLFLIMMKLTPVGSSQACSSLYFLFNHFDIASSLLLNNRTSVQAQNPLSLPAITKAHSLTNIGNSRLIAPPTPSIYLLLTRLPPLLYVWFPHCIYKNDFPHWPLTLVFFPRCFLSTPPRQNK